MVSLNIYAITHHLILCKFPMNFFLVVTVACIILLYCLAMNCYAIFNEALSMFMIISYFIWQILEISLFINKCTYPIVHDIE